MNRHKKRFPDMTDIDVFRRTRNRRDGDCPTGTHRRCDIIVVTGRTLAGSLHMMRYFHFDADETPTLNLVCIDGEMARVVAGAEGLSIGGLELLRDLAATVEPTDVQNNPARCACGNNPSPTDGFCRNCRPKASRNGRR